MSYHPNGRALSDTEIRLRLRAVLRRADLRGWPPRRWLIERGGADLVYAMDRDGGPRRWAAELGIPFRHRRGHRWTPETIAAALEPLLVGRVTWPNRRAFEAAGVGGLYGTIRRTEGHPAFAAR